MRPSRVLLLGCAALLLALPLRAEVFTVKLTNGASFESRYQPKQAAWDTSMLTVIDETGLEVAVPKALVAEVTSSSELKGFGRVINTTTVDLGYAPNDLPEQQRNAATAQQFMQQQHQQLNHSFDQQQFVEPSKVGGGIPVSAAWGTGVAGGGNYFGGQAPAPQAAPAPAPAPAPAAGGTAPPQ